MRKNARTTIGNYNIIAPNLIEEENENSEGDGIPEFIEIEDVFATPNHKSFKTSLCSNANSEAFSRNLQKSYITQSKIMTNRFPSMRDQMTDRFSGSYTQRQPTLTSTMKKKPIDMQNMTESELKTLLFT